MSKKDDKKTPSFENSMERLETLVDEMESGELSLDQMIAHFEEGSGLVDLCAKKLEEVEQKIETLVKKDGKMTTESFDRKEDDSET